MDHRGENDGDSAKEIGANLQSARKAARLTQKEVADGLRINLNTWQKYETGERVRSWVRIPPVARILETTPSQIFKFPPDYMPEPLISERVDQDLLAVAMQEVALIAAQARKTDDPEFWQMMATITIKIIEMSLDEHSTAEDARSYLQGALQGYLFARP